MHPPLVAFGVIGAILIVCILPSSFSKFTPIFTYLIYWTAERVSSKFFNVPNSNSNCDCRLATQ